MSVRELLERLLSHALDGRGPDDDVVVLCDTRLRSVEQVQTVPSRDESKRPRATFVLIVADGPWEGSANSASDNGTGFRNPTSSRT